MNETTSKTKRWHWYTGGRNPYLVYGTSRYDHERELVQDEVAAWMNHLEDLNADLLEALKALMRQTSNIEVLGEWAAEDRNYQTSAKVRAEVDAVKGRAAAAIARAEGRTS